MHAQSGRRPGSENGPYQIEERDAFGDERVVAFLAADEDAHMLHLDLVKRKRVEIPEDAFMLLVSSREGRLVHVSICTPPHPIALSEIGDEKDNVEQVARLLAREIAASRHRTSGIRGPPRLCLQVMNEAGLAHKMEDESIAMRVTEASLKPMADNLLPEYRLVDPKTDDFLQQWYVRFAEDAHLPSTDSANFFLSLETGRRRCFVSDACMVGANAIPVRLGPVYVPREKRGQGHAKKLVTAVCRQLFREGHTKVYLFADASNPISCSLYKKLGFEEVSRLLHLSFLLN